jgi:hypothetical protein
MACKIVDVDAAAHSLTEDSVSDVVGEAWNDRVRRVARGREPVMREVKILSKLSHVRSQTPCSSNTDTFQPHIVNLMKAFISSGAL